MMKRPASTLASALVALSSLAPHLPAADILKPEIGQPLRDASVARAPDGTFFLVGTGTEGTYQGKPDFFNNHALRVWSSKDLVTWQDAGEAINLATRQGWRNDPLLQFYFLPERPLGAKFTRALTTPRLAFLGGEAFLSFSMLGHDVRWLRAPAATGPWKDGRLHDGKPPEEHGGPKSLRTINGPGDGSLFADADGSAWLLWGPGFLAKLNPEKNDILHDTRSFLLARVAGYPNAEWCARQFRPAAFSLVRHDGKYVLVWSAFTDEAGHRRQDSFFAVSESLMGPYSEPRPLLRSSGPVTVFDAGDRGLMASCSVEDAPKLVPLTFQNGLLAAAAALPMSPEPPAARPAAPVMFDYAKSKPGGRWAEHVGEELAYQFQPVTAAGPIATKQTNGRSKLVPLFDLPMSDVAVCQGGDGAWYLTGTVASRKDKGADFQNNDGIYLWRSPDLATWEPLGKVWDIEKNGSAWAKQFRIPGDNLLRTDLCRGVTAPEIHFFQDTYWLAYSMNGRGTGLLRSKSGRAEGPYEDVGRMTAMGESPSLFVEDGRVFWLFGPSLQIATVDPASAKLTEPPRDLFLNFLAYPPEGWDAMDRSQFWDLTGPFLFRAAAPPKGEPAYALAFSAITQTFQRANRDTMVAVASALDGTFQAAARMIPNGGQTTVFPGTEGEFFATFWGADPSAIWRNRPGLLPLEWYQMAQIQWPRKFVGDYSTTRGPWDDILPPANIVASRDNSVFKDRDGFYYYCGSGLPREPWEGGTRFWRTKDLRGPWEDVGFLHTMEQMRDDPNWPPLTEKGWNSAKHSWEPELSYGNGTYWLSLWFGGHGWGQDVAWKQSVGALLRSSTGKIEGPYVFHSKWSHDVQGPVWTDEGPIGRGGSGEFWKMDSELKGKDPSWAESASSEGATKREGSVFFQRTTCGRLLSEDIGTNLQKIGGKWVLNGLTHHTGYDAIFSWADDLRGPWHYMGVVPNLGNSQVVQNVDGKWLTIPQCGNTALFGTPYRNTSKTKYNDLFLYEVTFNMDGPEPSVWPTHDLGHLQDSTYTP